MGSRLQHAKLLSTAVKLLAMHDKLRTVGHARDLVDIGCTANSPFMYVVHLLCKAASSAAAALYAKRGSAWAHLLHVCIRHIRLACQAEQVVRIGVRIEVLLHGCSLLQCAAAQGLSGCALHGCLSTVCCLSLEALL